MINYCQLLMVLIICLYELITSSVYNIIYGLGHKADKVN